MLIVVRMHDCDEPLFGSTAWEWSVERSIFPRLFFFLLGVITHQRQIEEREPLIFDPFPSHSNQLDRSRSNSHTRFKVAGSQNRFYIYCRHYI